MDIHLKIENIKRYFSHKIAVNEFKLLKLREHTALIEVDSYEISMWIGNGPSSFDFFADVFSPILGVKFDFLNDDQKKLAYRNIMEKADKYKNTITREYLTKSIAEMQEELKQLDNE